MLDTQPQSWYLLQSFVQEHWHCLESLGWYEQQQQQQQKQQQQYSTHVSSGPTASGQSYHSQNMSEWSLKITKNI